jgi:hypothetical protein
MQGSPLRTGGVANLNSGTNYQIKPKHKRMKKSILVIAVSALAMASCRKDLAICECTITTDKDVERIVGYEKVARPSELEKWCEEMPKTLLNDTISKAECKLE